MSLRTGANTGWRISVLARRKNKEWNKRELEIPNYRTRSQTNTDRGAGCVHECHLTRVTRRLGKVGRGTFHGWSRREGGGRARGCGNAATCCRLAPLGLRCPHSSRRYLGSWLCPPHLEHFPATRCNYSILLEISLSLPGHLLRSRQPTVLHAAVISLIILWAM